MQDILKVLSGNIVAQGIGFLTIIIISRDLGAEQYGVFSLLLAIFTISIQISDFGISTSYVKYVSENLSKAKDIFFTIVISKIVLSFLITILLYFLAETISIFFFESTEYAYLIQFMSFLILFHTIFGVIVANYQALQKFKQYATMKIVHNLFRMISIIFISLVFSEEMFLSYFIQSYISVVLGLLIILFLKNYKFIFEKYKFNIEYFIEIYKLGFWIFLSSLATMIIMRLDIMMLGKMSTVEEVGYYSVAMNVAMIFPLITTSLTTTLLPKVDEFIKNSTIDSYVNNILNKTKYIVVLLLLIEILAPLVISLLFGEEYQNSINVFQILLIAFLFGVIINPIALIFYHINKAYILTILNWIQLPLNYVGNLFFIPLLQAEGAALSTILLRVFAGIYIIISIKRIKNV